MRAEPNLFARDQPIDLGDEPEDEINMYMQQI